MGGGQDRYVPWGRNLGLSVQLGRMEGVRCIWRPGWHKQPIPSRGQWSWDDCISQPRPRQSPRLDSRSDVPPSAPWAGGIPVRVERTLLPDPVKPICSPGGCSSWEGGLQGAGIWGEGSGSPQRLPMALLCRCVSMTSWRCAAACPLMPGCTASSAALRRPRPSPHRATTCAWSSSPTTRSPDAASGPTSSQVRGFGGQTTD